MDISTGEVIPLKSEDDILYVRHAVRNWMTTQKFSLIQQTKMVTAASELSRNTLIHGGGGSAILEPFTSGLSTGLRVTFEDNGPGIPDIKQAMQNGYTTGGGLGLGLGGSQRLVQAFEIESTVGQGTRVSIAVWK